MPGSMVRVRHHGPDQTTTHFLFEGSTTATVSLVPPDPTSNAAAGRVRAGGGWSWTRVGMFVGGTRAGPEGRRRVRSSHVTSHAVPRRRRRWASGLWKLRRRRLEPPKVEPAGRRPALPRRFQARHASESGQRRAQCNLGRFFPLFRVSSYVHAVGGVSLGMSLTSTVPAFVRNGSRFDVDSFIGRLNGVVVQFDPLKLLASDAELEAAIKLLELHGKVTVTTGGRVHQTEDPPPTPPQPSRANPLQPSRPDPPTVPRGRRPRARATSSCGMRRSCSARGYTRTRRSPSRCRSASRRTRPCSRRSSWACCGPVVACSTRPSGRSPTRATTPRCSLRTRTSRARWTTRRS